MIARISASSLYCQLQNATAFEFFTTSSTDREQILLINRRESDLGGDTDDTAGGTAAGVAGGERVLVTALAEVVGAGVDNDGAADNRVGADERDLLVCGISELLSATRQNSRTHR